MNPNLTEDEIDAMEQGCKLNALVSEIVFNKKLICVSHVFINGFRYDVETWIPEDCDPKNPPGGSFAGNKPIDYSGNIQLSFRVVDEMDKKGFGLLLHCPGSSTYCDSCHKFTDYYARFERKCERYEIYLDSNCETSELAICKSAIKTILFYDKKNS